MTSSSIHLAAADSAAASFLEHILAHARDQGLDQGSLAARAGIAPESLSRLKKAGRCRLTTALELACAAGLTSLELRAGAPAQVASAIAARKLSAGRRLPITASELVAALRGHTFAAHHRAHLYGFFEELPIETVHDVALDERLDFRALLVLARELGAEGETLAWLEEMAGDGVA